MVARLWSLLKSMFLYSCFNPFSFKPYILLIPREVISFPEFHLLFQMYHFTSSFLIIPYRANVCLLTADWSGYIICLPTRKIKSAFYLWPCRKNVFYKLETQFAPVSENFLLLLLPLASFHSELFSVDYIKNGFCLYYFRFGRIEKKCEYFSFCTVYYSGQIRVDAPHYGTTLNYKFDDFITKLWFSIYSMTNIHTYKQINLFI